MKLVRPGSPRIAGHGITGREILVNADALRGEERIERLAATS
jgi:hypothetical protein